MLKTQHLDLELDLSIEARKKDKEWQDVQQNILCIIRPLLTLYDTIAASAKNNKEVQGIVKKESFRFMSITIKSSPFIFQS